MLWLGLRCMEDGKDKRQSHNVSIWERRLRGRQSREGAKQRRDEEKGGKAEKEAKQRRGDAENRRSREEARHILCLYIYMYIDIEREIER